VSHARRVLEFDAVLERLARHCQTSLGAELALALEPAFEEEPVWELLEQTREAESLLGRASVPSMAPVADLRDALRRAEKGGTLGASELAECAWCLQSLRQMKAVLAPMKSDLSRLWSRAEPFPEAPKVEARILESVDGDGTVRDAASPGLAALRRKRMQATAKIAERIQSYVAGKAREYLSDPIYTVRDGRYVLPVRAEHKGKIRGIVHDTSGSGQTVYVEPEDVLQLGNALRQAEAEEREEVQRVLAELSGLLATVAAAALASLESAAELDLIFAKARYGGSQRGALPERLKRDRRGLEFEMGRHPLLDPETVVPVTLSVGVESDGLLITGPNTGGKTVAIKTAGLFALMAQCGMMLPAERVRLKPFTAVWADIGDEQSLQQSLSTFSGHIKNIAAALKGCREGALVLLDEIGAGTDPAEGAALAKAILLEFRRKGAAILASTHYGELKAFAYNTEGFANAAMEFDAKTLRPTFHLIMGAPGASHALKIAERHGIPSELVRQAQEGLGEAASDVARMLEQLESAQKQARTAQSEADRRAAELKRLEEVAERKLAEADEVRRTAFAKANARIEEALREIRLRAEELFEDLKGAAHDPRKAQEVRTGLKALQEVGREVAAEFREPETEVAEEAPIERGMTVRVEGYSQIGTVLEAPRNGKVAVQLGPMKLTVEARLVRPAAVPPPIQRASRNVRLERAQHARSELHLRAMRAEEAERELERFLDDAVLAGLPSVRIVHGKGEGVLRQLTREMLKRHPHVGKFADAEPAAGGAGVTVAELK
jgi:DNA mismatch repair protein MutS2